MKYTLPWIPSTQMSLAITMPIARTVGVQTVFLAKSFSAPPLIGNRNPFPKKPHPHKIYLYTFRHLNK
jgi:hypothetical protein